MIIADTFWKRLKGLAWSNNSKRYLLIPNCSFVHTWGMRYAITLFWFNKKGHIIQVDRGINPKRFVGSTGSYGVLECGKGLVSDEEAQSWINGWIQHKRMMQKSFTSDNSGQALVETALLLPVIVLFLFGFLQIGILMFHKQQLLYVNNYSVQVGSVTNDDSRMIGAVEETYDLVSDPVSIDIQTTQNKTDVTIVSDDRRYKDTITVVLEWDHPLIIPLFAFDSVILQTKASARVLCREDVHPYTCE